MAATWLTTELLRRLESLELSVRWVRAGTYLGGVYPINRRGSSVEFADYMPYHPGDDIRAIDWNLYARLDRLFVKTYKEEIELSVDVIVDATASMGLPTTDKFERAKQIAICLAYIGLSSRHHVRIDWLRPGPVYRGRWSHRSSDLVRLIEEVEAASLGAQMTFTEWMQKAIPALRLRGGQVILITDGMIPPADFFRAINALLIRNLEIKVIQVLTEEELRPAKLFRGGLLVDVETGITHQLAYSASELDRAVSEHNEQLVKFCRRHGIPFVRHMLAESLDMFMIRTLPRSGFLE